MFPPRSFAVVGITGATERGQTNLAMRESYRKLNGRGLTWAFPIGGRDWELVSTEPNSYSTPRRKLAVVRAVAGHSDGESRTLHSPWNFLPSAVRRVNSGARELIIAGRCPNNAQMPGSYDRSVCLRVCARMSSSCRTR